MESDPSGIRKEEFVNTLMSREDGSYERQQAQHFITFIQEYFPLTGSVHEYRRIVYSVVSFLITDAPRSVVEEIKRLYYGAGIQLQEWEITDKDQLYLLSEMLLSFDLLRIIDSEPGDLDGTAVDENGEPKGPMKLFTYDCMQYVNNTDMHWLSSRIIVLHDYLLEAHKAFEHYQGLSRVKKLAQRSSKPRRRSIGERVERYGEVMQSVHYLQGATSGNVRPVVEV